MVLNISFFFSFRNYCSWDFAKSHFFNLFMLIVYFFSMNYVLILPSANKVDEGKLLFILIKEEEDYGVKCHFQQYFSFIGERNQSTQR